MVNSKAASSGLIFLGLLFVGPIAAARSLVGGTWSQVGASYVVWIVLLSILLGSKRGVRNEKLGFMLVFAMPFTILVVPLLTVIMRMARFLD